MALPRPCAAGQCRSYHPEQVEGRPARFEAAFAGEDQGQAVDCWRRGRSEADTRPARGAACYAWRCPRRCPRQRFVLWSQLANEARAARDMGPMQKKRASCGGLAPSSAACSCHRPAHFRDPSAIQRQFTSHVDSGFSAGTPRVCVQTHVPDLVLGSVRDTSPGAPDNSGRGE